MMEQETVINSVSVSVENQSKPICDRPNVYQSFWIFFIGAFIGFFVETIWCLLYHGRLEYRSSFILFPFSTVYGLGALVLYLGLRKIEKNKILHIFAFGAVTCTAVEYICSLIQEKVVGTVSWDYSATLFNIGGRVCLELTFAWGLLAVLWVLLIQPFFEKVISKIPARVYKPLTWGLAVILAINLVISVAAIARWGVRLDGIPPSNIITVVIDKVFPNGFMSIIYPSMRW